MVSENNDHYENSDGNCEGRMREDVSFTVEGSLDAAFQARCNKF